MAPIILLGAARALNLVDAAPHDNIALAFPGVKTQWQNPSDLFSILLLVGGDIIQRAIAQLSSPYYFTPVAFSFGWVSYAVNAITSAIGDGKLMPETDCPSILINAKTGYSRNNSSWILGRILRDWDDKCLRDKNGDFALVITMCKQISPVRQSANTSATTKSQKSSETLIKNKPATAQPRLKIRPRIDEVWLLGVFTIVAQICISIVPGLRYGTWTVAVITVGGTLVCLGQSALPQWSAEKFKCRPVGSEGQTVAITRGNGHNHVLVIETAEGGLNLEDLAVGRVNKHKTTLPLTLLLSVLWFVVLLTAIAVQENTWFLLLVGSIGMVQNIFAAGYRRKPAAFGIRLEEGEVIRPNMSNHKTNKVFPIIQEAEKRQSGLGIALLPVFFPGELFPAEQKWKDETVAEIDAKKEKNKAGKVVAKVPVQEKPREIKPNHDRSFTI